MYMRSFMKPHAPKAGTTVGLYAWGRSRPTNFSAANWEADFKKASKINKCMMVKV